MGIENRRGKGGLPVELPGFQNGPVLLSDSFTERSLGAAKYTLRPIQQFMAKETGELAVKRSKGEPPIVSRG